MLRNPRQPSCQGILYDLKNNLFIPIDHSFCFNSNNLDKEPYLIAGNESILETPFLNRFFNRHLQTKTEEIRLEILNEFKNNCDACCQQLDTILAGIPNQWHPDRQYLKERLAFLFAENWLIECQHLFTRLFIQNLKQN